MSPEPHEIKKWGFQVTVTKELRSDAGVDVDEFVRSSFVRSLPDRATLITEPAFEWFDLDAPENVYREVSLLGRYTHGKVR